MTNNTSFTKSVVLILALIFSAELFAIDITCPEESFKVNYTSSTSGIRTVACQKKVDGKYVNHGPTVTYSKNNKLLSKKHFSNGKLQNIASPKSNSFDRHIVSSQISMSQTHTCLILNNSKQNVLCWGNNKYGQLGDGTSTSRKNPAMVIGIRGGSKFLEGVKAIYAHKSSTCAIMSHGNVLCWGRKILKKNEYAISTPEPLMASRGKPITGIVQLAYNCALSKDKSVLCWGDSRMYRGNGKSAIDDLQYPTIVRSLKNTTKYLIAKNLHRCALSEKNEIRCWGFNTCSLWGGKGGPIPKPNKLSKKMGNIKSIFSSIYALNLITENNEFRSFGILIRDKKTLNGVGDTHGYKVTGFGGKIKYGSDRCVLTEEGAIHCLMWVSTQQSEVPISKSKQAKEAILPTCALGDSSGQRKSWINSVKNGYITNGLRTIVKKGAVDFSAVDHDRGCAILESGTVKCWNYWEKDNKEKNKFLNDFNINSYD